MQCPPNCRSPAGTTDNSPALQCWVRGGKEPSPDRDGRNMLPKIISSPASCHRTRRSAAFTPQKCEKRAERGILCHRRSMRTSLRRERRAPGPGSGRRRPGWTTDNSPALQCWVRGGEEPSPDRDGRNKLPATLSSLRDLQVQPPQTQHSHVELFLGVPTELPISTGMKTRLQLRR